MARPASSTLRLIALGSICASLVGACQGEAEDPGATDNPVPPPATSAPVEGASDDGRVPLAADSQAEPATTLCHAQEAQVFSCKVRGGKIASVCLAKGAEGEFAQYRFGQPGAAPELVWPTSSGQQMEWASVPYSGGSETQLSFAIGDVRYVVYSKIVRTNFTPGETNDPAITDGVAVLRSGKVEAEFACRGEPLKPVDVSLAQDHLAEVDGLFTYDTQ